eukprot:TRINITY_DN2783_c0_g1_i1.p1 TRINITY_DN2783_c0_g1~~TRINITY_DN2783_c0_g1_i1.p1  ORF type:complete len:547 (-),score=130.38 TRINITY_DN2783_c0_g1_i1:52-1692(-)
MLADRARTHAEYMFMLLKMCYETVKWSHVLLNYVEETQPVSTFRFQLEFLEELIRAVREHFDDLLLQAKFDQKSFKTCHLAEQQLYVLVEAAQDLDADAGRFNMQAHAPCKYKPTPRYGPENFMCVQCAAEFRCINYLQAHEMEVHAVPLEEVSGFAEASAAEIHALQSKLHATEGKAWPVQPGAYYVGTGMHMCARCAAGFADLSDLQFHEMTAHQVDFEQVTRGETLSGDAPPLPPIQDTPAPRPNRSVMEATAQRLREISSGIDRVLAAAYGRTQAAVMHAACSMIGIPREVPADAAAVATSGHVTVPCAAAATPVTEPETLSALVAQSGDNAEAIASLLEQARLAVETAHYAVMEDLALKTKTECPAAAPFTVETELKTMKTEPFTDARLAVETAPLVVESAPFAVETVPQCVVMEDLALRTKTECPTVVQLPAETEDLALRKKTESSTDEEWEVVQRPVDAMCTETETATTALAQQQTQSVLVADSKPIAKAVQDVEPAEPVSAGAPISSFVDEQTTQMASEWEEVQMAEPQENTMCTDTY